MFFTVTVIVIVLMSVAVHELSHAIAMRECGVRIQRISLLGLPGIGTIRLPIRSRQFPGAEWVVHPLIVGAYVLPVDGDMERLPPRDTVYVAAMGPIGSVAFAFACVALYGLLRLPVSEHPDVAAYMIAGAIGMIALMWYARRFIARYLMPLFVLVGTFMAVDLVLSLATHPVGMSDGVATLGETGAKLREGYEPDIAADLLNGVLYGAVLSALLGIVNLMAMMPFDGGRIVTAYMSPRWRKAYLVISVPVAAFIVVMPLLKDAYNLARWMFSLVIGS